MSELFKDNAGFNGDISCWDTSRVATMERMFWRAKAFNQAIDAWDTSRVSTMHGMFYDSPCSMVAQWNGKAARAAEQVAQAQA